MFADGSRARLGGGGGGIGVFSGAPALGGGFRTALQVPPSPQPRMPSSVLHGGRFGL